MISLQSVSFSYKAHNSIFSLKPKMRLNGVSNITFEVHEGDRVALLGKNGAGKSTLLRLISGVFPPDSGVIETNGSIGALYGKGVGINANLTGRQNLHLRALFLGLNKASLGKLMEDVIAFIDIGDNIDAQYYTYSQGMKARVSFGMLMLVSADILLIDEALGAGDRFFIKKARMYVDKMLSESSILIFASHSEHLLRRFCNKALLLDKGELMAFGNYDAVNDLYKNSGG